MRRDWHVEWVPGMLASLGHIFIYVMAMRELTLEPDGWNPTVNDWVTIGWVIFGVDTLWCIASIRFCTDTGKPHVREGIHFDAFFQWVTHSGFASLSVAALLTEFEVDLSAAAQREFNGNRYAAGNIVSEKTVQRFQNIMIVIVAASFVRLGHCVNGMRRACSKTVGAAATTGDDLATGSHLHLLGGHKRG